MELGSFGFHRFQFNGHMLIVIQIFPQPKFTKITTANFFLPTRKLGPTIRTDEEPEVALEAEAMLLRVRDEVWLTLLLAASAALVSLPRPPSVAFCISTERNSLNLLEAADLSSRLHNQNDDAGVAVFK